MTKTKAFFICFVSPLVILGFLFLFVYIGGVGEGLSGAIGMMLLIGFFRIILLPLSLLITPFFLGKKWGVEFRKYGFYGSLVSLLIIISLTKFF